MVDAQLKGCYLNGGRRRFQALAYASRNRAGKRQRQVQVGSGHPLDALAQQRLAGLIQRRAHGSIRPQCKEQALRGFSCR
jgi:F0F1-type ATP synthase delta subunit